MGLQKMTNADAVAKKCRAMGAQWLSEFSDLFIASLRNVEASGDVTEFVRLSDIFSRFSGEASMIRRLLASCEDSDRRWIVNALGVEWIEGWKDRLRDMSLVAKYVLNAEASLSCSCDSFSHGDGGLWENYLDYLKAKNFLTDVALCNEMLVDCVDMMKCDGSVNDLSYARKLMWMPLLP